MPDPSYSPSPVHYVPSGAHFSPSYYQSSSLASALTPMTSMGQIEGQKVPMWPQAYVDSYGLRTQSPNTGWAEHRAHGQSITRSSTVMPERYMNRLNTSQNGYKGNQLPPPLPEHPPRRAFTPAPQDIYPTPYQRNTGNNQSPTPYYVNPNSDRLLYTGVAPVGSTAPAYNRSSIDPTSYEEDILYLKPNMDEEQAIHCPHSWCKSTFSRTNDLARHLATASMHRESAPLPAVDASRRCRFCGEEFSRSDARARHENKKSCGKSKRSRKAPAVP